MIKLINVEKMGEICLFVLSKVMLCLLVIL